MEKINIIKIIKKIYPSKKQKLSLENDLINDNILDSLELMKLILYLENNYKFKVKKYIKKNKKFVVKNLQNYLN